MPDSVALVLSALACMLLAVATLFARRAARNLPWLRDQPPFAPGERRPSVSVIAPARDEARHLERAVRALLAQSHAPLELVLVDDRSGDDTPRILARLAAEFPRLRVETVDSLPPGWLGKNHANWRGAAVARGELLLFTDADVVMAPEAIERAAACLTRGGWDHLTVAPRVLLPGAMLSQFTLYFGLLFSLYARPWAASDPRSRAHVGIGAFNLVRRDAYFAAGGHERLRMRPDDDMKLGKLLKRHGGRQLFLNGLGAVEVEWYASWREVRDGLMKNLFAGAGYSIAVTVAGSALQFGLLAGPPLAPRGARRRRHDGAERGELRAAARTRRGLRALGRHAPLGRRAAARVRGLRGLADVALDAARAVARRHRVARHALPARGIAPEYCLNGGARHRQFVARRVSTRDCPHSPRTPWARDVATQQAAPKMRSACLPRRASHGPDQRNRRCDDRAAGRQDDRVRAGVIPSLRGVLTSCRAGAGGKGRASACALVVFHGAREIGAF